MSNDYNIGDRITLAPGEDRDIGKIVDLTDDGLEVAWDSGVVTHVPVGSSQSMTGAVEVGYRAVAQG